MPSNNLHLKQQLDRVPLIEELLSVADMTDVQRETLEALVRHNGNYSAAAKELGVNRETPRTKLEAVIARHKQLTGKMQANEHVNNVPEGYRLRGVSTHVKANGEVISQWQKTQVDPEAIAIMERAALDAFKEKIPRARPVAASKKKRESSIINLYTITDYHIGALAWDEECGEDWDTEIAEDLIYRWFDAAISDSPDTEKAIFNQLGDFLHIDNLAAVTPASGHILDADTRLQKIVRVAIRVMRRIIHKLLTKHEHVHVIVADANHDEVGAIWMREWLAAHFEDEPRVFVDQGADGFYCHQFGAVANFFHHGHKAKADQLDRVFAARFREVYGNTRFAYAHCGHLHHEYVKETSMMKIRQHPTLAARDAYAARLGLMAMRQASVITYHKDYGQVGEVIRTPEMVRLGV